MTEQVLPRQQRSTDFQERKLFASLDILEKEFYIASAKYGLKYLLLRATVGLMMRLQEWDQALCVYFEKKIYDQARLAMKTKGKAFYSIN